MKLFNLYTDLGADSEGFELSLLNILSIALAIVLFAVCRMVDLGESVKLVLTVLSCAAALFNLIKAAALNIKNGRIISEALVIAIAVICLAAIQEFFPAFLAAILYQLIKLAESLVIDRKHALAYSTLNEMPDSPMGSTFKSFKAALKKPGRREELIAKFFRIYTPALLIVFLIISFIVPIFTGEWSASIKRGAAVLLWACPLGVFSMVTLGRFWASRQVFASGAYMKDSRTLETISSADTFICNKTCLLTEKEFYITDIKPKGMSESALISLVNAVEAGSFHPIAEALRRYSGLEKKDPPQDLKFTETPGRGITAYVGENIVYAGNAVMLFEHEIQCDVPDMPGIALHVAVNGSYCGYILFENRLRQDIYNPLEKLHSCGIKRLVLLSSDLRSVVRPIASSLNFDTVKAELSPENKLSSVEYLVSNANRGATVIYAGNGCAELAFSEKADVGVCIDAEANPEAMHECDISILQDSLNPLPELVSAAKTFTKRADFSIGVSLTARLAGLLLLIFGVITPVPAILLAFISSMFIIIMNSAKS